MSAERRTRPAQKRQREFELVANGASGKWAVSLQETSDRPVRRLLAIEGRGIQFCFEVGSAKLIDRVLALIEAGGGHKAESSSLRLSREGTLPAWIVKDNEYIDRFFLIIGQRKLPLVHFPMSGDDIGDLVDALKQAKEDL